MDNDCVRRQVKDNFFIHNVFSSFFAGVLEWFGEDFYPRFQWKVVGTYSKSVQYFNEKRKLGTDPNEKLLPAISLDPMLDFSPEERGGRFLWQFSRYAPGIGMQFFKGIDLKEQDVLITPVFSRYQGTFELTFWLSSVYELLDFRVSLLQFMGGYNRWVRPKYFWTYMILPEEIENFETDPSTHTKLDWSNTTADLVSVSTINKTRLAVPFALDPIWRLESFGDSSTKYGGDSIAEYKLSATLGYELNIPTYVVLDRGLDPRFELSFSLEKVYTKYPLVSPYKILKAMKDQDVNNKYFQNVFKLFTIDSDKPEETVPFMTFSSDSVYYPPKYSTTNYIVSGTLVNYNSTSIDVTRQTILYIEKYKSEYLQALRRCGGVICRSETAASDFYSKCQLLNKPTITYITDSEFVTLSNYFGKDITLDSVNRSIYNGKLRTKEVPEDDPSYGYPIVSEIQNQDPSLYDSAVKEITDTTPFSSLPKVMGGPADSAKMLKRLLKDDCDGIQTQFQLGYILDDLHKANLLVYLVDKQNNELLMKQGIDYTVVDNSVIKFVVAPERGMSVYIGGQLLIIRDSKLVAVYEFSLLDSEHPETSIIVQLPVKIETQEDLVLVSYIGRLEYGKDYTLDVSNQTVTILLKPLVGEIVQFFYYITA